VQIALSLVDPLLGNAEAKIDAVLSVFYKAGGPNSPDNADFEALQVATEGKKTVDSFDMDAFVNGFKVDKYYVYDGSLTEPPCTEGIKWIILPDVKEISDK